MKTKEDMYMAQRYCLFLTLVKNADILPTEMFNYALFVQFDYAHTCAVSGQVWQYSTKPY